MQRRREGRRIPVRPIVVISVFFFIGYAAFLSFPRNATAAQAREVQIGNLDFVISVPAEWEHSYLEEEMKLHMRVLPMSEVQGRFTVYVRDRTSIGLDDWVAYHKQTNLPSMYGSYLIDYEKEVKAGLNRAWIFHMLDLSGRQGYGLYETLVLTGDHVIFLSYLYDLYLSAKAEEDMQLILGSLTSDLEAVKRARLSYDEGRTLGLVKFGLFLRLPEGWFPQKKASATDYQLIKLPSGGSLEVAVAGRLPRGDKGLQNFLKRKIKPLDFDGEQEAYLFGCDETPAFSREAEGSNKQQPLTMVYGFHNDGGYGLALRSRDKTEKALFHKVTARAWLVDPACAKKLWAEALDRFERAIQQNEVVEVREALSTLELFSGCSKTAKKLDAGFDACEDIQVACAVALGRLASSNAGSLLERNLNNDHLTESGRKACIRAMAAIGTPREKKCLEKLQKKTPRYFSEGLKAVLDQSLQDLGQAQ